MMSHKIPPPPKEELEQLYEEQACSISKLARHYSTSHPTVRKWLRDCGVARKSHVDVCRAVNAAKMQPLPPRCELEDLYQNSTIEHLKQHYRTGQETIWMWLDAHGIRRRSRSESAVAGKAKQYADKQIPEDILREIYTKHKNIRLTADELDISYAHLRVLKERYGITTEVAPRSVMEQHLLEFVQEYDPDARGNDRMIISPKEIDIVSDSRRLAIEYCGVVWHSERFGQKHRSYHADKAKEARAAGYDLVTVFETDDIERVKNLLRTKFHQNERIAARKCAVEFCDQRTANDFHNTYHLHNSVGASSSVALMHEGNIVGVMSFGKCRFSTTLEWECRRMTFVPGVTVVGGVSKMLTAFVRKHSPQSIVTFADLRFGTGQSYRQAGFEYMGNTAPNYWYFNPSNPVELYSRVKFQKHKLGEILPSFDPTVSEWVNMQNNGYDRIWDCGNAKYAWFR